MRGLYYTSAGFRIHIGDESDLHIMMLTQAGEVLVELFYSLFMRLDPFLLQSVQEL